MIEAKPVVADSYWILKQNDRKVGTVEADATGIRVRIHNQVKNYRTMAMVRDEEGIDFRPEFDTTPQPRDQVYGHDVGCGAHNRMWDAQRCLPLFTKTRKSKSWYAAGWYCVRQHRVWQVMHNPKLIILDRYQFQGPFHTKEQARDHTV